MTSSKKYQIFFRFEKRNDLNSQLLSQFFQANSFTDRENGTMRNFYTWKDEPYRNFMIKLLYSLEPRFIKARETIMDEFDECLEIMFVLQGSVVIGYEINKQRLYCMKCKNKCIIGDYGITFNQRSPILYTALTDIHALTIRKEIWFDVL
jgi:CRP-like cAMP-binding protein